MTELLVGTKKGLVVLRGDRGGPLEIAARAFPGEVVEFATRDPRSGRYFAGRHARPVRPASLLHRRSRPAEVGAGRGPRLPGRGQCGGRAHLGDRAGRRRRRAVVRRRAGRAVPQRRRRQELGAGGGPLERARAAAVGAGCRRAVPALDLPLAGRSATGWRSASRRPASGSRDDGGKSWRRSVKRPGAALYPGGGAQGHARLLRPQHAARAAPARDALHAVPRRRLSLGRRRRELDRHRHRSRAFPPTSASRSPSIPTTPTAPSSSRWRPTWTG